MMTFDGRCIAPDLDLAPSLEAIALGLARESRWCGQTSTWFPVLAHTFLCADLATNEAERAGSGPNPMLHLHLLLHDAAEAVTRDIPTTWKTDADRSREKAIMARIYSSLGLGDLWPLEQVMADGVGYIDWIALRAEATVLMPPAIAHAEVGPVGPISGYSQFWPAVKSAARWKANVLVYPQWLPVGAFWQRAWVADVQTAIKAAVRTIEIVPGGAS